MPIYKQTYTYYEDGHGDVEFEIRIARHQKHIYTDSSQISDPQFIGETTELDDMTIDATSSWSGTEAKDYRVEIDTIPANNTFKWSNDGGVTWTASLIPIKNTPSAPYLHTLEENIIIRFAAENGHTVGTYWDFATMADVGIFEVGDVERKVNDDIAGSVEQSLSFSISQAAISTDNETNCLTFLKSGSLITFGGISVAIYINPSSTPVVSEQKFMGVVEKEYDISDFNWDRTEFSSVTNNTGHYQFNAKPIFALITDEISAKDILINCSNYWDAGTKEWVFNSTWLASTQIFPAQSYIDFTNSYGINALLFHVGLCSLDIVLRRIADTFEEMHRLAGFGEITISFIGSEINPKYHPARWHHIRQRDRVGYDGQFQACGIENDTLVSGEQPPNFLTYDSDWTQVKVDPDSTTGSSREPFYLDMKTWMTYEGKPRETEGIETAGIHWTNNDRLKSFQDIMTFIAWNLGVWVDIKATSATNINVSFVNSSDIPSSTVYIKDAIKSSVKITAIDNENPDDKRLQSVYSTPRTVEGADIFECHVANYKGTYHDSNDKSNSNEDYKLMLTISPTVCRFISNEKGSLGSTSGDGFVNTMADWLDLPVNTYPSWYPDVIDGKPYGSIFNRAPYFSRAIMGHNGLIVKVPRSTLHPYWDREPANYYTHVAAMSISVDNKIITYDKLSDYIKQARTRLSDRFYYERDITIPYFYGISSTSSSIGTHWNLAEVRNQITLDSIPYTIVSSKFNFNDKTVSLKLKSNTFFTGVDTPPADASKMPSIPVKELPPDNILGKDYYKYNEAGEDIYQCNLCYLNTTDNKVYRVDINNLDHYDNIIGLCRNETASGSPVDIILTGVEWSHGFGSAGSLGYSPAKGDKLYLIENQTYATRPYEANTGIYEPNAKSNRIAMQIGEFVDENILMIPDFQNSKYIYL